jgi:hypothetical protein
VLLVSLAQSGCPESLVCREIRVTQDQPVPLAPMACKEFKDLPAIPAHKACKESRG